MMTVPTNTPLQQQIDEFIAEGASRLPADLLQDLLSPIGQLITSGAAEQVLILFQELDDMFVLTASTHQG